MLLPLTAKQEPRNAELTWAKPPAPEIVEKLRGWASLTDPSDAEQTSAAEIAGLAAGVWEAASSSLYPPAATLDEMKEARDTNPYFDTMGLLVLRAEWFADTILGFCLFERTWSNNIFMAYLAHHPKVTTLGIKGTGTNLLFAVCDIAVKLEAGNLWAQTTHSSANRYKKFFELPEVTDRLDVPFATMVKFCEDYRSKWQ